ncbi:TetR/AcrR family transcriptional regulator [Dactylosporangium sp. CS-047395]|uniref:TetR/AcrR family transcriptional regulator n=1 Tax=Dactylosporangium sp. CS-047395 TaxID=3239936 RepID=UPI003D8ED012
MPRDGGSTREHLLDAAERLVERNGFAATSVEMILSEAGSSKGAFFHHFTSKRALAHALVERYVTADLGTLAAGLQAASAEREPKARLLRFLDHFVDRSAALTSESACLYIAVLVEQDLLDEQNSAQVERAILGWRESVAALMQAAFTAAPTTRPRPAPEDLADQLFAVIEGAFLMCRAAGSPEPMRRQLLVYRQLVAALF